MSDLEPVSDYPGASPWFSAVSTPVALRSGPHMAALYSSRFARTWCDACGRRRGADGRCPSCDPWWTSPFYVYGSLLTVGVTALLLTVLPLLRSSVPGASGNPTVAVLSASPSFGSGGVSVAPVAAPPAVVWQRPVSPVVASHSAPVVLPPTPADAGLADLARLRAMTDYAAGVETRRDASRSWRGIAPESVASFPVVQYSPARRPLSATPVSLPTAAPMSPFAPGAGGSAAGERGEDAAPIADGTSPPAAPQRTL